MVITFNNRIISNILAVDGSDRHQDAVIKDIPASSSEASCLVLPRTIEDPFPSASISRISTAYIRVSHRRDTHERQSVKIRALPGSPDPR